MIHCGQATPRNTLDAAKRILSVTSYVVVTIQNNYHIHHYRPRSSPGQRSGTPTTSAQTRGVRTLVEQYAQPRLVEHRHPE